MDCSCVHTLLKCPRPHLIRPHFYQTRSAWSMDQGSNENHSPVNNFVPTVTKFCVLWEGQALPHDTKFGNCRDKIVDSRAFLSWSLIHGSSWSGLIKLGPGHNLRSNSFSPWTKWPPYRRRYFQMNFREWVKCHYLNKCWLDSLTHICETKGRWVGSSICYIYHEIRVIVAVQ